MINKFTVIVLFSIFYFLFSVSTAYAVVDPLAQPNNMMGIHILFPSELEEAAQLVNSSGGSWGYATIPIQSGDRDLDKWQQFMNDAKRLHVIPILRLATQPNPFNTNVWRKPNDYDILDFANFLSSLSWPTQNKYVILFNEVNRFDEWGGEYPDPETYASLVSYANEVFKKQDPNFYLVLSGMDDSAPNDYKKYINGFTYLERLIALEVNHKIDGFSSHSYPNPGFSAYPSDSKKIGVATYKYEYELLNATSDKKIPAFITETGWGSKQLPDAVIAKYFQITFDNIWSQDADKIIAITPFILKASGTFDPFSFIQNGNKRAFYTSLFDMKKTKGEPMLEENDTLVQMPVISKTEQFKTHITQNKAQMPQIISAYLGKILGAHTVVQ